MKKSIFLASIVSLLLMVTACGDNKKNSVNSTSTITSTDINSLFSDRPLILEAVKSVVSPDLNQSDEGQLADFCNGMSTINSAIDLQVSNPSFLTQAQYDYLKMVYDAKKAAYTRACF